MQSKMCYASSTIYALIGTIERRTVPVEDYDSALWIPFTLEII